MKQTYRAMTGYVLGWVWLAFVAYNIWDLTTKYNGKPTLVAAAVLAVLTAVVYVTTLRPATTLTENDLRVRNPFRSHVLPWASVGEVNVSHSINITREGEGILRLWTPQSTARERARANRRATPQPRRGRYQTEPTLTKGEQAAAEVMSGKTHADFVAEQITERAEKARRRNEPPAPTKTTWAIDSIAAFALAAVLVVIAILG